jgi:serine protein kinase
MEDAIEQVVSYFRHAAQGLEEKKQILCWGRWAAAVLIAERLKALMQEVPFYAIKGSPVNESPLGLFDVEEDGPLLEEQYGIPRRYLNRIMSPGPSSAWRSSAATSASSRWSSATPAS